MSEIVLSSRVRLARNYADLPFRSKITPDQGEDCVQRTLNALRALPQPYLCVNTLRYDGGLSVAAIGRPLEEELP